MNHVDHLADDYLHGLLEAPETQHFEDHCAVCSSCREAVEAARKRLKALRDLPATEASPELVDSTLDQFDDATHTTGSGWRRTVWFALTGIAACTLLLLGVHFHYSGLRANPVELTVLGQQDLLAQASTSVRVRLFDRERNQALGQVPGRVELVAADETVRVTAEFQTDARGIGQPVFAVPDLPEGLYRLRVTTDTTPATEVVEQRVRVRRSWQVMLSTDKPIYQPGQTIHLRALALRRPALLPVADQVAVFMLTDPKGNVLLKESIPTSRFGLASVDCPLAREIAEGTYILSCKIGDSESRQPVSILKYVLPKFAVALDFNKTFYLPGDEVICTARVNYTTGKPVVGGAVQLQSDQGAFAIAQGITDADGRVRLRTRLPGGINGDEMSLAVTCKVVDRAEQTNVRHSRILVSRKPLHIDFLPENGNLVAGVSNTIHILARHADGSPAQVHLAVDGQLEVFVTDKLGSASFKLTPQGGGVSIRYRATDVKGRLLDTGERSFECGASSADFLVRTDRAVYQAGQTMKISVQGSGTDPVMVDLIREGNERYALRSELVEINGAKEIDLNPELVGTLSLLAYRFGHAGITVQKTRLVQVLPAGELQIQATLDQAEYRPGGEAGLKFKLTTSAGKPVVGAVSLAGVDEAVFALLPIKPGSEQTYFTLDTKALEGITARYHWSPVGPRNEALDQAIFSATARALNPPRPVPGPNEFRDRGLPIEEPMNEEAVVRPRPSAGLPAAAGLSLDASSYREKLRQLADLKSGVTTLVLRGWLLLGGLLLGLGYASLWIFLPRRETLALHAGFALIGVPLLAVVVMFTLGVSRHSTFEMVAGNVGMAEAAKDGAHEPFRVAENAPPRGDDPAVKAVPGAAPRVRDYFPETLVWKPELVTDENGEVELKLPLADSITTWRLNASAVDAQGRLGARELGLKVFQPFFVDFNLPVALTRNDQVSIPVVVSSYLDKPQSIRVTLKAEDWYELIDGKPDQQLEIRPGEVKVVHYRIAIRKAGLRELEVRALADGVEDTVRRPIDVLADGCPVDLNVTGSLDLPFTGDISLPENAIEGSARLLLKIHPSRFSQVVEGLSSIFRMPSGCFEQTSSTTYPNVLALDYLQRTRQDKPEVAARARHYIRLGYQRLIGFEVRGGGFDWFGQGEGNPTLTAYGLMEFEDMDRVHKVDPALLDRTRRWLLERRSGGKWHHDGRRIHANAVGEDADLATTAYIARAVFAEGRSAEQAGPTREYLLRHSADTITNPYTLALVAGALLGIDPAGTLALPYVERLDRMATAGPNGQVYWSMPQNTHTTFYGAGDAGNVEVTALATLALIRSNKAPETVRQALAWLVSKKDRQGTWHSTQATVLSLQALLAVAERDAEEPKERVILVRFGDFSQTIRVPKEKAEVMQVLDLGAHLTTGKKTLEVSEPSRTGVGFQVTYRYHRPGEQLDPQAPLALKVRYGRTEVAPGGTTTATARVKNGADRAAAMLLVEVPVPAGFAVRGEDFAALVTAGDIARYEIEPGRVLVYLREMPRDAELELPYTLEARQVVDTTAPGGRVYEYYNPAREAFGAPTRLRVIAP